MERNRMSKHLFLNLIAIFVFMIGITTLKADVHAAAAKLSSTSITLASGKTKKLKVKNAKGKKVKWSSTKSSVASVSSGKVTAKKGGTATIKAKVGKKTLKCKVKVIGLNLTSTTRTVGESFKLTVKNGKSPTWSSSNSSVASVTKAGKVTVKKTGAATIYCKTSGKTVSCKVYVPSLSATSLMLTPYNVGKKLTLNNSTGSTSWSTGKSSVAIVNGGTVLAKGLGKTTITATNNGKKFTCTVTVVNLNHTTLYFNEAGETNQITCENFTGNMTWSSSNPSVVEVSSTGAVRATGNGNAVISCNIGIATLKCYVQVGNGILASYDTLNACTGEARRTVPIACLSDINGSAGLRYYTVYGQSYDSNKISESKGGASILKSYLPNHGCATCSLTTVLCGFTNEVTTKLATNPLTYTPTPVLANIKWKGTDNEAPGITFKYGGIEYNVFDVYLQHGSWLTNYKKSLSSQMPVSLNGIRRVLNYYSIPNNYVQSFNDETAIMNIYQQLLTGDPVVIEVCNYKRSLTTKTSYASTKWSNSSHTMVLLAMTKINGEEYAVVADPADRSSSEHGEGNKRIKYVKLDEIVAYMFWNTKDASGNYYNGKSSCGGYILVN